MSQPKTILFIEDDQPVADMYNRELARCGFQVEMAPDGNTALNKATNKHYDILLVDLMIPRPDGTEVIKKLRGQNGQGLRNSKLVVLTNLALDDHELAKLEPLIDKYVIKANTVPSKLVEILNGL